MLCRQEFLEGRLEPVVDPPADLSCSICQQEIADNQLVRLPCHETHIYCVDCIKKWLEQVGVNSCPQCRSRLFDLPANEYTSVDDDDNLRAWQNELAFFRSLDADFDSIFAGEDWRRYLVRDAETNPLLYGMVTQDLIDLRLSCEAAANSVGVPTVISSITEELPLRSLIDFEEANFDLTDLNSLLLGLFRDDNELYGYIAEVYQQIVNEEHEQRSQNSEQA